MKRVRLPSLLLAVAAVVVVGVYGVAYAVASQRSAARVAAPATPLRSEAADTQTQIAFWSKRVAERPKAYLDLTLLGQAFVRRARETGDVDSYRRAEAALRRALRVNPKHVEAAAALAGVLVALHDFAGALATAAPIVDDPRGVQALATLGDARLALGRYGKAQAAYARLLEWSPSAGAYSRVALVADLRGDAEQAARLMERAALLAADSGGYGESLAWFTYQRGELAFRAGLIEEAEGHYRAALRILPGYALARGGLAKSRAALGDVRGAIRLYRKLVAASPQIEYVAALGDLLARAGNAAAARKQYATVEAIGRLSTLDRRVYDRQLAIFYADRGVRLQEARRLALGGLRVRKDVYAYDAAAWALARSGHCREALPLVTRALRLGTRDALLYFHRGYVEGCAGNRAAMHTWYAKALALNPAFSAGWTPVARAAVRNG